MCVREREREIVCVCVKESLCVCVCVCELTIPVAKKNVTRHSCLRLKQMIIIDGQLTPPPPQRLTYISSPARKEKKTMKTKPARHFQVGYIHNQRSIYKIIFVLCL